MFESIIICKENNLPGRKPIDLGSLAEALLFYQSVHIIAEQTILKQLIVECGYDILIELLKSGFLRLSYLDNFLGIQQDKQQNEKHHYVCREPCLFEFPKFSLYEFTPALLRKLTGSPRKADKMADQLFHCIEPIKIDESTRYDIFDDIADSEYVTKSIEHFLRCYAPEYNNLDDIFFSIAKEGPNLIVETNIDFAQANRSYHLRIPPTHSSLSAPYFISLLSNIRRDLNFASNYNSEISTLEMHERIFELKFTQLLKHLDSENEINLFQEFVFNRSKSIGEAITAGERDFSDMLVLLREAKKFKRWLKGKDVDDSSLIEYYKEATKSSWVEKLPSKVTRWILCIAVGTIIDIYSDGSGAGKLGGLALSATDTFLLERIIKGWKPNLFIKGPVDRFIS